MSFKPLKNKGTFHADHDIIYRFFTVYYNPRPSFHAACLFHYERKKKHTALVVKTVFAKVVIFKHHHVMYDIKMTKDKKNDECFNRK